MANKLLQFSLFILLGSPIFSTSAQDFALAGPTQISELMKLKSTPIARAKKMQDTNLIFLEMPFAKAHFSQPQSLPKIRFDRIYAIYLVYTKYRQTDSFDQPELNRNRYENLAKFYPGILKINGVEWKALEQTKDEIREDAAHCFHGFVIMLKPENIERIVKTEISKIQQVLSSAKDTQIWVPEKIIYKVKRRSEPTGKYYPKSAKKRKAGILYTKKSIWNRDEQRKTYKDSTIKSKTGGFFKTETIVDTSLMGSTLQVYRTLQKRKWSPKVGLTIDVTGSMSQYLMQVLLWLKNSPQVIEQGKFAFFNDGNNLPDGLKKKGASGGIYIVATKNFDSIAEVLYLAMLKGQGGDLAENNLEAVRELLKSYPDLDTVLMIADAKAPVKDFFLLKEMKKPISIILCGVEDKVHSHYLEIAGQTGGRLFVLDTELANVKSIKKGEKIRINNRSWELRNGTLQKIN